MSRFASTQASEGEALGTVADAIVADTMLSYIEIDEDDPTLTAAQLVNGIVVVFDQTTAQDVTTPTAAEIIALIPNCQVGSSFELTLINGHTSSGDVTLVAGEGVATLGTVDVPVGFTQLYKGRVTDVADPEVVLIGLLSTAQLQDLTAAPGGGD